jgi:hypothetical protein
MSGFAALLLLKRCVSSARLFNYSLERIKVALKRRLHKDPTVCPQDRESKNKENEWNIIYREDVETLYQLPYECGNKMPIRCNR